MHQGEKGGGDLSEHDVKSIKKMIHEMQKKKKRDRTMSYPNP